MGLFQNLFFDNFCFVLVCWWHRPGHRRSGGVRRGHGMLKVRVIPVEFGGELLSLFAVQEFFSSACAFTVLGLPSNHIAFFHPF